MYPVGSLGFPPTVLAEKLNLTKNSHRLSICWDPIPVKEEVVFLCIRSDKSQVNMNWYELNSTNYCPVLARLRGYYNHQV